MRMKQNNTNVCKPLIYGLVRSTQSMIIITLAIMLVRQGGEYVLLKVMFHKGFVMM